MTPQSQSSSPNKTPNVDPGLPEKEVFSLANAIQGSWCVHWVISEIVAFNCSFVVLCI